MRPPSRGISAKTTARAPPPAPSTTAVSSPRSQPGAAESRLARKPSTSVLVERSRSPSYQRVLAGPTAPARPRALVRLGQRKRCLLVRHRDIAADIAVFAQMCDKIGEFFGRYRFATVFGIEIVLFDPVIVDQRRARVAGRPGYNADSLTFLAHISTPYSHKPPAMRRAACIHCARGRQPQQSPGLTM